MVDTRAQWKPPPYLYPTHKGYQPFRTWAFDCRVSLQPPAPNGGTTIVLAIDAWTKWLEYKIRNPLDSRETSIFLYKDVICREPAGRLVGQRRYRPKALGGPLRSVSPTAATGRSAYELVYKQSPALPVSLTVRDSAFEEVLLDWTTVDPSVMHR